jgi:drug/metabolite transporter (DMT)-like permease
MWLFTAMTTVLYLPYILTLEFQKPTVEVAVICAGSLVCHLLYFLALDKAYQFGDLSIIYPVARGLAPAVTVLFAIILLKEALTIVQIAGVLMIVAGTFALSGLSIRGDKKMAISVLYAVLCGLMVSGYTVIDKVAVANTQISPFLLDFVNNFGRTLLLAPAALKRPSALRQVLRENWQSALIVAVLSPFSYLLVLFAMRYAPVSLISPVRQLSIVLSGLYGIYFLSESKSTIKFSGIGITFCGVLLLSL